MTWEYIAGFFDGEGSLVHNGKGYRANISQTNKEVLDEIKYFSGVGLVCKITKRQAQWKDSWVYYVSKQKDVDFFVRNILPFVYVKKDKIIETIPKLDRILELQKFRSIRLVRRKKEALKLRESGLSYWRIGQKMGLDRSYVRKLILGKWKS